MRNHYGGANPSSDSIFFIISGNEVVVAYEIVTLGGTERNRGSRPIYGIEAHIDERCLDKARAVGANPTDTTILNVCIENVDLKTTSEHIFKYFGAIAQLAEQFLCKEKVNGSTPFSSTS